MALAIFAGCEKKPATETPGGDEPEKPKTMTEKMAGEWHCSPTDMKADIYVSFAADGKFELYQQITEGAYRLYRGTWNVADEEQKVITGKYNDGEDWGSSYVVTVSDENSMTLEPISVTEPVKYDYTRTAIPAEVKDNCVIMVRSAESVFAL